MPGGSYLPVDSGTAVTASDSTGDQGVLSGLGDLFSSVGVAVSQGIAASQGPQRVGTAGLYYNPTTGTYVNASPTGIAAQSAMSPLLLLLGVGLVVFLVFKR